MNMPMQLQSYVGGRFVGARAGAPLASAIDGRTVAFAHADELDFGEAVAHARRVGVGRARRQGQSADTDFHDVLLEASGNPLELAENRGH